MLEGLHAEPHFWREAVRVEVIRPLADAVHAGKGDDAGRARYRIDGGQVEAALPVVGVPTGRVHLPAQSETEGELRTELPGVLDKGSPVVASGINGVVVQERGGGSPSE